MIERIYLILLIKKENMQSISKAIHEFTDHAT
jgi:hypothetical protein